MSKMSALDTVIQMYLDRGMTPHDIVERLDIPIRFVYESMELHEERHSPYATMNS